MDVLLVDDESLFLLSLADGLHACFGNVHFVTAENGKKAMEILDTFDIDVVITDLKMPVMGGFELIESMRKEHPTTPVVVMTAFNDVVARGRLENLGVRHMIEKPVDLHAMADIVQRIEREQRIS